MIVYGTGYSPYVRKILVALAEKGVPYEHVPCMFHAPDAAFQAASPLGKIPAIDDDGFKLSESMAINLYLAKKHGKLQPATPQSEAKAIQWSFWAAHEVDRQVVQWVINTTSLPVEQRNVKAAFAAREELEWPL
ncbi:MAG: glutathione S-transferase family protein, partial [Microvirga sp.]